MTAFRPGREDLPSSVICFQWYQLHGLCVPEWSYNYKFNGTPPSCRWSSRCHQMRKLLCWMCGVSWCFNSHEESQCSPEGTEPKCCHFWPFCWHSMHLMGLNLTRMDSLNIVSSVFWTTNCLAPPPPPLPNWGHPWQLISRRDLILQMIQCHQCHPDDHRKLQCDGNKNSQNTIIILLSPSRS